MKADWDLFLKIGLFLAAAVSAFFSYRSNKMSRRLFAGQMVPHLQIRLLKFTKDFPMQGHGTVVYEILNHTTYPAFRIETDFQYSTNDPIMSWNRGRITELQNKGKGMTLEEAGELEIRRRSNQPIDRLGSYETVTRHINGSIPADLSVRARVQEGFPVQARIVWYSEQKQRFEESKAHKLICTKVGDAEEYTFLSSEGNGTIA